jgi:hypothetical protein
MIYAEGFPKVAVDSYPLIVNNNAEGFPKVAVDSYPLVVNGVKFVSTFVDSCDQSLVPNIGEFARAEDDVKEFKANWSL